jgi:hypothetical protein|tara:strand:- start:684 stop:1052 length:369 start_codon:yes stop_codon:yes gene_type:complete
MVKSPQSSHKKNKSKKSNTQKDNIRFKIILWGFQNKKGFIKNSIMKDSKSGIKGQKWVELNNRLSELIEWGLLASNKSEHVENDIFFLTERGREIAKEIVEWEKKFPELWNFQSFSGVKLIG